MPKEGIVQPPTVELSNNIPGHCVESQIKDFVNLGHIDVYEDKTFRPKAKITRAESVLILSRVKIK